MRLAAGLRRFYADTDRLDRHTAETRLSADPNRTPNTPGPEGDLRRARYFGENVLLEVSARGGRGIAPATANDGPAMAKMASM